MIEAVIVPPFDLSRAMLPDPSLGRGQGKPGRSVT